MATAERGRHGSYIFQRPGSANWYIKLRSGAVILGTAIVLSPALASCSAKDCAYYGSPDANTRCVVISAPTTGGGQ